MFELGRRCRELERDLADARQAMAPLQTSHADTRHRVQTLEDQMEALRGQVRRQTAAVPDLEGQLTVERHLPVMIMAEVRCLADGQTYRLESDEQAAWLVECARLRPEARTRVLRLAYEARTYADVEELQHLWRQLDIMGRCQDLNVTDSE
jgi:hypothetical protein